ncbi:MAG TPA: MFS transporter [Thermoplasmata archaeon]|nr:MFS transporter [Thermoplasmata archaeon]
MTESSAPTDALPSAAATPAPTRTFETLVIAGIMLSLLMGALDQFVVLTALPTILAELGQPSSGTFVVTAYIIASTVAIPIFGKLSDLWSRRNVFLGGLAVFIVGSMLAGLSQSLPELIVFRAVQGFGSGGFFPVGIAIVGVSFPPATRARITGLLSGVFGIATVAGPLLGSTILDHTTWRWVFYVNLPVGLVGATVLLKALGPLKPERARRFDLLGAGLLVGWVGALEYALIQVSDSGWSWTDPRVLGLLGTAAAVAVGFVLWELYRAPEPLVPLRLLAKRVVGVSGATTFLIGAVFLPLATFVSLVVGLALTPPGASSADIVRDVLYALVLPLVFGAALGGQLITRLPYRVLVLLGAGIAILGMAFLRGITASTPTWVLADGFLPVGGVVLPLIPLGFGIGMTFPVFVLAVQNSVRTEDFGEASGLIQFLQQLGGSIGLSVFASYALSRLSALDPLPSAACETAQGPTIPACLPYLEAFPRSEVAAYDLTFTVMLGLLVAAAGVALFLKGRYLKSPAPP